jgi:hypothetical protein
MSTRRRSAVGNGLHPVVKNWKEGGTYSYVSAVASALSAVVELKRVKTGEPLEVNLGLTAFSLTTPMDLWWIVALLRTTKAFEMDGVIIVQMEFPAVNAKTAEVQNFIVE